MNANVVGKTLVFVHLVVSVLLMTWGAAIYLQQLDWGWKEPRREVGLRVPSEIDKRRAAVNESYRAYKTVEGDLKPAQQRLREAAALFAPNYLLFVAKINELRNSDDPIKVLSLSTEKGRLKLTRDDPDRLSPPLFGNEIPGIVKSQKAYEADSKKLIAEAQAIELKKQKVLVQQKIYTLQLNGEEGKDGKIPGLMLLKEMETQLQAQIRFETDYVRPKAVRAMEEKNGFLERKKNLEASLQQLKERKKK